MDGRGNGTAGGSANPKHNTLKRYTVVILQSYCVSAIYRLPRYSLTVATIWDRIKRRLTDNANDYTHLTIYNPSKCLFLLNITDIRACLDTLHSISVIMLTMIIMLCFEEHCNWVFSFSDNIT